jgi:hypothetical protein
LNPDKLSGVSHCSAAIFPENQIAQRNSGRNTIVVTPVVDDGEPGCTLDLLPTIAAITGAQKPNDRLLRGFDLSSVLFENGRNPRENLFLLCHFDDSGTM